MRQCPHNYVQFVAVSINFLLTVFKDSVGNGCLRPADVLHLTNAFLRHGSCVGEIENSTSFFQNVRGVMAVIIQVILQNWWFFSDQILSHYCSSLNILSFIFKGEWTDCLQSLLFFSRYCFKFRSEELKKTYIFCKICIHSVRFWWLNAVHFFTYRSCTRPRVVPCDETFCILVFHSEGLRWSSNPRKMHTIMKLKG